MPDTQTQLLIGIGAALLLALLCGVGRWRARRRQRALFRQSRAIRKATVAGWVERGWLGEGGGALPRQLSPAEVFLEWAWVHPEAAAHWKLRAAATPDAGLEEMLKEVWGALPGPVREASSERLAAALKEAPVWWGGAERGWNGRPLVVQEGAVSRKQAALPLLPIEDLTGAPSRLPLDADAVLREADGPEQLLLLAALRGAVPEYTHPLAPPGDSRASLVSGLSGQVTTDLGRRVGAGLGAALGPIGSMVGQYLGEMAGALGGKALARQAVPAEVAGVLEETERALSELGALAGTEAFARAVEAPAEQILELGGRLEKIREKRARGLRERLWPTPGQALLEATMRLALDRLHGYRAATDHFVKAA
ncbi:MAG TPA: hypothetical protein VFU47_15195, partial [Armatimonadota bacterium]|nr:hypothetical protein [Armatimonadota bacterium]